MIKFLIMDVDGTLTDGKIHMSDSGELFKTFDIKDGYGIKELLPAYGIEPVIITARNSVALEKRCSELHISFLFQSAREKLETLETFIAEYNENHNSDYSLANIAYIGDDLLDMQCMLPIKAAGGVVGCPKDATDEVRVLSDFVSRFNGGDGAVRDFIEHLVKNVVDNSIVKDRIDFALSFITRLEKTVFTVGKYVVNEWFYYLCQEYFTKEDELCVFESHRHFVDIQLIVSGEEKIEIDNPQRLVPLDSYDEREDVQHYQPSSCPVEVVLRDGCYVAFYPTNAYRPCIRVHESQNVKKIVGKVKID